MSCILSRSQPEISVWRGEEGSSAHELTAQRHRRNDQRFTMPFPSIGRSAVVATGGRTAERHKQRAPAKQPAAAAAVGVIAVERRRPRIAADAGRL